MQYYPDVENLDAYWETVMQCESVTAISNWHNPNSSDKCVNEDLLKHADRIADSFLNKIEQVCNDI
ncbi:MAG: hypothetical protein HOC71_17295 [Candidatus Latescibacteria bacterium]|nr:hypothetical protein [Candidatus Latescibacterota bacterium]